MYTSRLLWWVFLPFLIIFILSLVQFNLVFKMPPKPRLNVHNFPRPPLLEKTPRHLQIKWNGKIIAETKDAYWVLETTHPPSKPNFHALRISSHTRAILSCETLTTNYILSAYYFPPSSILTPLTTTPRKSICEWKGMATYYSISRTLADKSTETIKDRIWSYNEPTESFKPIAGYLSFYAGPWDCYVDGELVTPQPGDFYGGWMTSDIEGKVKGGPGTWGW
jgi:uncharacterized protein (DUF427 family)